VLYTDVALINYFVGRKPEAFKNFSKAIDNNGIRRRALIYDPKYDPIKNDPEFSELFRQHGLIPGAGPA